MSNDDTQLVQSRLSETHLAYLRAHAITDKVLAAADVSSDGDRVVFPWRDNNMLTRQTRQWPEPEGGLPQGTPKYLWEAGHPLHMWALRPLPADSKAGPVIIAEGTKQSLAVASYAPSEYAVYGIAGVDGWRDLSAMAFHRFAGHPVIILIDADAGDNLNVYESAEGMAAELESEDAVPGFVPSLAWGTDGIDDYLARFDEGRRTDKMAKLLARAQPKPAERRPSHRKLGDQEPETNGRPVIVVNEDRVVVVHSILARMRELWDGRDLFNFGGAMTRLRYTAPDPRTFSVSTEPLDRDSLARWIAEAAFTCKYKPPGANSPGTFEPAWPEVQTMGAVLSSGDDFVPLDRISRTPFIRSDGSVCFKNGYDESSRTFLAIGNSGMDRLDIPDAPTPEQVAWAVQFLLGNWLGDMPFPEQSSRANALALVLTSFIRGLVPLVPLAVVSGLQPGVGKNLLADCISLMVTGEAIPPLPWASDKAGDEENRKQITSAFRAGAPFLVFDEVVKLSGSALTRAITSLTYTDRILGVSKLASFPNRVTWIALGNNIDVPADMSRRSYFIDLRPDVPEPEDRLAESFTHSELRTWTLDNRPELVTAALIVLRSWWAAGCPEHKRGASLGSFEGWDRMMSGILHHAGVPGFLAGLTERRRESDSSGGYWSEHLAWLSGHFRSGEFTVLDVAQRAAESGGTWDSPPGLDDPAERGFARSMGAAYSRVASRWFGQFRLIKMGIGHRKVQKWFVQTRDDDGSQISSLPIPPAGPETETVPDLGGRDTEGSPSRARAYARPHAPVRVREEGTEGMEVSAIPSPVRAGADARVRTREDAGGNYPACPSIPPVVASGLTLGFDLETGWADQMFRREPGYHMADGTGFVRLCGITGPTGTDLIVPVPQLLAMLGAADQVYGHNILGFDGLALAWHEGMDWDAFCAKARDTELIARQYWPPRSREKGHSEDKYGLDAVAARIGVPGKTDSFKDLAKKWGDADKIPVDDEEFRAYLNGDLDATRAVYAFLSACYDSDEYLPREHKLARIAGHMRLNGLGVDEVLLEERYQAGEDRKRAAMQILHEQWDLPLSRSEIKGRGRGKEHFVDTDFDSPLTTGDGQAWLAAQWDRFGVVNPPKTDTGKLAIGSDELEAITARKDCPAELRTMITFMNIVTTTRTVYQTARAWMCPDGRVHPSISFRQASGRWSVTEPGLTVFGKHEGRHVERDIFVARPGYSLWSFDLAQVDMRAIAGHCQDHAYMALFEPGRDAHDEIAARVFGEAPRDKDGHHPRRQDAKARGHGWNYGMGPERMIRDGVDPDMAYGFDNGMTEQFPVLCDWREQVRAIAAGGGILDNGFGRRMKADPRYAYTVAPALMGQGGARDILGECMIRLDPALYKYLLMQVHDELVFELPDAEADEAVPVIEAAMTGDFRGVPVICDKAGPGRTWGEISGGK